MSAPVHWTQIQPEYATGLRLPDPDVIGPINERGTPCPWPWVPQQIAGDPTLIFCALCGTACITGASHGDHSAIPKDSPNPLSDRPQGMRYYGLDDPEFLARARIVGVRAALAENDEALGFGPWDYPEHRA